MIKKSVILTISIISILLIILVALIFLSKFPVIQNSTDSKQFNNKSNVSISKILNSSNLPKIVHHNFIELDKISKISKFRSGVGHDFSRGKNETDSCRSMKHYFEPIGIDDAFWQKFNEGKISKSDWPRVKYFAPVNGTIIDMCPAKNIYGDEEDQFLIQSKEYSNIWFGFFHVIIKEGLHKGSNVKSGEFLGTISPGNSGEIAVSINPNTNEQSVSFFELIDKNVFLEYKKRGIDSIDKLIITKKERDKNPLICDKKMPHRFIGSSKILNKEEYDSWSIGPDNWVFLI